MIPHCYDTLTSHWDLDYVQVRYFGIYIIKKLLGITIIDLYVTGFCVADNLKFSVLISVYINDPLEQLVSAVESVINQSRPPDQLVIVLDGPVSDQVKEFVESLKREKKFFVLFWI